MSRFVLQIVDQSRGRVVVTWPPGSSEEHDLVRAIVQGVQARGVGFLAREAHVLDAVRSVVEDAILSAKAQVRP